MSEELKSLVVEQEQARKEDAFKATRYLLRNTESREPIINVLKNFCGNDESKIGIEMKGLDIFLAEETSMSDVGTERGLPFVVWDIITEQMKNDSELTSAKFENEEFLKQYIKDLPEKVYHAYVRSGSVATY